MDKNFVCWNPDSDDQILTVDAVVQSPAVVLATHSDFKLRIRGTEQAITEEDILARFQDRKKPHMHAVFIGPNGSGKSHLVRWLAVRLPPTEQRKVIWIQRDVANLRSILELILEGMEGKVFDDYRQRLKGTTGSITPELARRTLLANLANAMSPDGPYSKQCLEDCADLAGREELQDLMDQLPALLQCEEMLPKLIAEGGFVGRLVDHTLFNASPERRDQPISITGDDLPLQGIELTQLGRNAKLALHSLKTDRTYFSKALEWMNYNRDWAITKLLQFSGHDLIQLMVEVRTTLKGQGKELVLLIEDFASMQAYDKALLDAVLIRPTHDRPDLCALRTAFAVTPGYMSFDTIEQRIDLFVDLDVPYEAGEAKGYRYAFAAKYLNAMRLPMSEIDAWGQQAIQGTHVGPITNHCDSCKYRIECHSAFGEESGVGFYPFTSQALDTIYEKAKMRIPSTRDLTSFNPRVMVHLTLARVLKSFRQEFVDGVFPPKGLADELGGIQLSPEVDVRLRSSVGAQSLDRYRCFVYLWGNGSEAVPSTEIYEAFGLMKPTAATVPPKPTVITPTKVETPAQRTEAVEDDYLHIDRWNGENPLPDRLNQKLMQLVHRYALGGTPSDELCLTRSQTIDKLFLSASMSFPPPETRNKRDVMVALPLKPDLRARTALALKALLKLDKEDQWNSLSDYLDGTWLIDSVSDEVMRQVSTNWDSGGSFDPPVAAAGLLVRGAMLSGNPDAMQLEGLVGLLTKDESSIFENGIPRCNEWMQAVQEIRKHWNNVGDILRSLACCTKGSAWPPSMMDAGQYIREVERALNEPESLPELPDNLPNMFGPLLALGKSLQRRFVKAIEEEFNRVSQTLEYVEERVPLDQKQDDFFGQLQEAITEAATAGTWKGTLLSDYEAKFGSIGAGTFSTLNRLKSDCLAANSISEKLACIQANEPQIALDKVYELVTRCESDLDKSQEWTGRRLNTVSGMQGMESDVARITAALTELAGVYKELVGSK